MILERIKFPNRVMIVVTLPRIITVDARREKSGNDDMVLAEVWASKLLKPRENL